MYDTHEGGDMRGVIGGTLCLLVLQPVVGNRLRAGPDDAKQETPQLANYLFSGIKAGQESLKSGMCRIRGKYTDEHPTLGRLEGDITAFLAFDYDQGKLRFDCTMPSRDVSSGDSQTRRDQPSFKLVYVGGKYIKRPDYQIEQEVSADRKLAAVVKPSNAPPPRFVAPFDIRALPLSWYGDVRSGTSFKDVLAAWEGTLPNSISRTPGQPTKMTWKRKFKSIDETNHLWVEETGGVRPIKLELALGNSDRPCQTVDIDWRQVGEVWLPHTYSASERCGEPLANSYSVQFEWIRVNEALPEEVFLEKGLELDPGTLVLDKRLGSAVISHVAGTETKPSDLRRVSSESTWQRGLLIAIACFAMMLAVYFVYRRSRAR